MWGFGMMFWLVPLLVFALLSRRGCWAPAGWRGGEVGQGRWSRREGYWPESSGRGPRLEAELEQQRDYIDRLERQVADLEERLDFTERLLGGRGSAAE